MKGPSGILACASLAVELLVGCSRRSASQPQATGGAAAQRTFRATSEEVLEAISNAFENLRYHNMMLAPSHGFDLIPGWSFTNGFVLVPSVKPVAMVPTKSQHPAITAPYFCYFHIRIEPEATNKTGVTVSTLMPRVVDGRTVGIHGGWADKYRDVPPVHQEEENVLGAIEEALKAKGVSH